LRSAPEVDPEWKTKIVELVRRTRKHSDLRVGSSVRGAIDATAVAAALGELRGDPATDFDVGLDAAIMALSGRVRVREGCTRTSEEIITELWHAVFAPAPESSNQQQGKAHAPTGATPSL
jgi:MoxR-like ATPase